MGKKKASCSEARIEFLIEKGKEFSKDLINKATKWELAFKIKLEKIKIPFIFQYPVICNKKNLFILDFYLPKHKLAIELDGSQHYTASGKKYDKRRTSCLKKEGIQVIRIQNGLVDSITEDHIKSLLVHYV